MQLKRIIWLLLLSTSFFSCSKSGNSILDTGFLKVTVDGTNYEAANTLNIAGTGGSPFLASCSGKEQFKQHHTLIENSNFFLQVGMVHNANAKDFGVPAIGKYNFYTVTSYYNNPYCYNNLTFDIEYEDKNSGKTSYAIQPGGTHNITSISKISSDNSSTCYAIEGNFSGNFKLLGGTKTSSLSGSYRMFIRVFN